jgi:hypothetical protein
VTGVTNDPSVSYPRYVCRGLKNASLSHVFSERWVSGIPQASFRLSEVSSGGLIMGSPEGSLWGLRRK